MLRERTNRKDGILMKNAGPESMKIGYAMYMDFLLWLLPAFFTVQEKLKLCATLSLPVPLPTSGQCVLGKIFMC